MTKGGCGSMWILRLFFTLLLIAVFVGGVVLAIFIWHYGFNDCRPIMEQGLANCHPRGYPA